MMIFKVADISFHPPKVLIKEYIRPTKGMPITKIPESVISIVEYGELLIDDQSTEGMA